MSNFFIGILIISLYFLLVAGLAVIDVLYELKVREHGVETWAEVTKVEYLVNRRKENVYLSYILLPNEKGEYVEAIISSLEEKFPKDIINVKYLREEPERAIETIEFRDMKAFIEAMVFTILFCGFFVVAKLFGGTG